MNEAQLRGIVAGFLHILTTTPEVFREWQNTPKEPGAMGALIQKSMNLKSAPTAEHLQAMSDYSQKELRPHLQSLDDLDAGVPRQVGNAFGMTQK